MRQGSPWHPLCIQSNTTLSGSLTQNENCYWIIRSNLHHHRNSICITNKVNKRGGKHKAHKQNLITLTHCNTTKNILERFYCLLRLIRGRSWRWALFGAFWYINQAKKCIHGLRTGVKNKLNLEIYAILINVTKKGGRGGGGGSST